MGKSWKGPGAVLAPTACSANGAAAAAVTAAIFVVKSKGSGQSPNSRPCRLLSWPWSP